VKVQQFLFNVEAARVTKNRYTGGFVTHLAASEARLSWSDDELTSYQRKRAESFFERLVVEVPAFRGSYAPTLSCRTTDVGPSATSDLSERFAEMTKRDLRQNRQRYSPIEPPAGVVETSTGGTTGDPLRFATTRSAQQEQWAIWWRFRKALGIPFRQRCGHFGGQLVAPRAQDGPPYWRHNRFMDLVYFSPHHQSIETVRNYVDEIHRLQIRWLHGNATALSSFAQLCKDTGVTFDTPMTWVTTGAESLPDRSRDVLQEVFGVRPRQHYGLAEGVANFSECPNGLLHVDEDYALVEFMPYDVDPDLVRIVGTALSNPATAFVRYDTGDLARLHPGSCGCGRPGRLVAAVEGRQADFVRLDTGELIGPVNQVANGLMEVNHLQMAKVGERELRVFVVPSARWTSETPAQVIDLVEARSPAGVSVHVDVVDEPLRTPNGKVRSVLDLSEVGDQSG